MKRKNNVERLYNKRAFLNKEDYNGIAAIKANVSIDKHYEDGLLYSYWIESNLTISDCSKVINLSCGLDEETKSKYIKSNNNTMYKLDLLIKTLTEYRDALNKARELSKKYHKEVEINEKKRDELRNKKDKKHELLITHCSG